MADQLQDKLLEARLDTHLVKNSKDMRAIYERLRTLEEFMHTHTKLTEEEQDTLIEAAKFYKAKKDFYSRLSLALIDSGIKGLVLFLGAAVLFYIKHLLTTGTTGS